MESAKMTKGPPFTVQASGHASHVNEADDTYPQPVTHYRTIIIGAGHAGAEAAWAAANLLPEPHSVALVTLDATRIGVMSCNPAIGGLAKGQLVREIDALGGLMALAADATGINFKMLNTSRGPAVRGPRCQCDKHAYARAVQSLLRSRPEIDIIEARVEELLLDNGRIQGIRLLPRPDGGGVIGARDNDARGGPAPSPRPRGEGWGEGSEFTERIHAPTVILTTGTFMRGLMHEGERQTPGGRCGEAAANAMSDSLRDLGFELGRLKTGTCPRLARSTIDWNNLEPQYADDPPTPFSDLRDWSAGDLALTRFPRLEQVECRQSATNERIHEVIKANLDRAPIFSGQIDAAGPRYCPSIEDKVVRFDRVTHGVFLEPESLSDESVYCNGISTSLPRDVQDEIVALMPGCERARILQYGYAVEYDMVRPHQILATCQTKRIEGLYLAGQINGTSGYEEAAAQGLVAGVNAARQVRGEGEWVLGRDQAYIGVLMDDLVTRTPVEPYRMFTSRAEHRLILRADNAPDRLTPIAIDLGLLDHTELGAQRRALFKSRTAERRALNDAIDAARVDAAPLARAIKRPEFGIDDLRAAVTPDRPVSDAVWSSVHADRRYEDYVVRQRAEIRRQAELERRRIPRDTDFGRFDALRAEARAALARFRPATFGQAGRLEGVTPADLTLLAILLRRASA